MPKRDDQRRINVLPGGVTPAASTIITETETHGGEPGVIGGWVFGPTALTGGKAIISSEGWLQVGVDDHLVRLDALDTGYRLWAGDAVGADAPFSIDVAGSLHAENAYLQGEIVADSGVIGGWQIGDTELSAGAGAARVGMRPGAWPFYAGGEDPAAAPYRVSAAGLLTAQGATIEGAITASSGQLIDLSVAGTLTLVTGGIIKSDNFSAGVSGWQIGNDGKAEFQDALVRGVLDTVLFRQNVVSTVAGTLRVEQTPTTTELTASLTIPAVAGYTSLYCGPVSPVYQIGDSLTVSDPSSGKQGSVVVFQIVTSGEGDVSYIVRNDGGATEGDVFPTGAIVYKATEDPGYLLITANPVLGGPRYAVVDSSGGVDTLVGVLGNLEGSFGVATKQYGVGLGDYASGNYIRYEPLGGLELRAGDGALRMSADGLAISLADSAVQDQRHALTFLNSAGVMAGYLSAFEQETTEMTVAYLRMGLDDASGDANRLMISSDAQTGLRAAIEIKAQSGPTMGCLG
ncbi:MAG: hypothetical protein ABFE07_08510, partial [Armatimonadia bacterium]